MKGEGKMNFDSFLSHIAIAKQYTAETQKAYRSDLEQFRDFMQDQGLTRIEQVDAATVNKYIQSMRNKNNPRYGRKGLSDASIARRLAAVSSYFEFVRASGRSDLKNPMKNMPMKWRRNREPKPVEEYTLDFLLSGVTNARDRALFSVFLASGLRLSEVHQLNRDSIRVEQEPDAMGKVRTVGRGEVVGKGNKRRFFFLTEKALLDLVTYLRERKDNNPALFLSERKERMSKRAMQWTLDELCRKAGFQHINIHRLRHTYATRLANAGIDSMILKDLMGHSSFATTQQYFKLTDKTIARGYFAAMESLPV